MTNFLIFLIKFYQKIISPSLYLIFPTSCRFLPTCSQYTLEAVKNYGLFKGTWRSLKRFLSCHPLGKGGFDPILDER